MNISSEILKACRDANACIDAYRLLRRAKGYRNFYEVIVENLYWVSKNKIIKNWGHFEKHCKWEKFDGWAWSHFLRYQPKFADRCPWEKMGGYDWSFLLRDQPKFSDRCPWKKLDHYDWSRLLCVQPQFADRCPWEKFDGFDWSLLLRYQPQLEKFRRKK